MPKGYPQEILRLWDANYNRAKEGLRVCEDVCRFVLGLPGPTRKYKLARHVLFTVLKELPFRDADLLVARDVARDVGRGNIPAELTRKSAQDIFLANSQRSKESVRVLEEFSKLFEIKSARALKALRYRLYALEKEVARVL